MKKLVEVSPLIAAFLVFNGFLRLYVYYMHWNIGIVEYLDFSEILLSFLGDLNIIILVTIILICQVIIADGLIGFIDKRIIGTTPTPEAEESKEEGPKTVGELPVFISKQYPRTFFVVTLLFLIGSIWLFLHYNNLLTLYFAIINVLTFLTYTLEKIVGMKEDLVMYPVLVSGFVLFTLGLARREIITTQCKPMGESWIFTTSNDSIAVSGKDYVIGKTKNYLFLYRANNKSVAVVPSGEIKKAEMFLVER